MGHNRLGYLPKTKYWNEVVALIAGGAAADQVAEATMKAAESAFQYAANDKGVIEAVWLLMRLPQAARSDDLSVALSEIGVSIPIQAGVFDIVASVGDAIDRTLTHNRGRTDLGEMAQNALLETLTDTLERRTNGLFETGPEDVKRELGRLATVKEFGGVARDFFGRLMSKTMDYFVSRVVSNSLGEGKRFQTIADQAAFTKSLSQHCRESSRIVQSYSGEWLSKANWQTGRNVSREDVRAFTGYAMTKISADLRLGLRRDGQS